MLNVDLSIRDGDGLGVVALRGEFKLVDAPGVASHLITAVAVCGPSVIVDLATLESICYSGLAVLLRIRKWTRASGGDLPLAAPQAPVRRILDLEHLARSAINPVPTDQHARFPKRHLVSAHFRNRRHDRLA